MGIEHDPREGNRLAEEWREARRALLELAAALPETRVGRATDRAGWTLKHELAHLAAFDAELRHFIDAARAGEGGHHAPGLRRVRGQAMLAAQELRLAPLREHLAATGAAAAEAIEEAGEALGASVEVAGTAASSIVEVIHDRLAHARASVVIFRQHVP